MTRLIALILIAAAASACSIDVRGEEIVAREERRFSIDGPLEVVVRTFDGAIEVRSWDRDEVLVEIERRASSAAEAQGIDVRTVQEGGRLTIEAPDPGRQRNEGVVRLGGWRAPNVSFVVTAPRRVTVQATSGDGAIVARDVIGGVTLRTGDGSVRAERIAGELRVNTGDGAVSVHDLQGGLELTTGDGAVDVSGRLETLRVTTGDGAIRVDAADGSVMKNDWTVQTGDGAIALRLPSAFDAELDASSNDGRITVAGVGRATPSDGDDQPAQLRARLGNGGPALRLRTGDGAITVTR